MLSRKALDSKIILKSIYVVAAITAGVALIPIILIQGIYLGITTVWNVVSELLD